MTSLALPETAPNAGVKTSFLGVFRAFPLLIGDRGFVVNVIALSMTSAAFFAFVAAAPYIVVETMGQGPNVYGAWFMLNALGYMAGNFAMSRLARRHGAARMIRIGLTISTVAMAVGMVLALSPAWSPLTLFVPLMINAAGNGLTIPGATAEALSARPELAGSAAGLMGAIQLGAGALATVLVSWAVTLWPPVLIAMSLAMMVFAMLCLRIKAFAPPR